MSRVVRPAGRGRWESSADAEPPERRAHAHVIDGVPTGLRKVEHDGSDCDADAAKAKQQMKPRRLVYRQECRRREPSNASFRVASDLRSNARALPLADPPELRLGQVERAPNAAPNQPPLHPALALAPRAAAIPGGVEPARERQDPHPRERDHPPLDSPTLWARRWTA